MFKAPPLTLHEAIGVIDVLRNYASTTKVAIKDYNAVHGGFVWWKNE